MRKLKYWQAISEATVQAMAADPGIFVAGEGVDDPTGIYRTTKEAHGLFGRSRVIDLPNSENACAGMAVGAASMGMRPLMVHIRADFMFLAMDALINVAAKWRYMYGNQGGVPVVTRGIVGRGWGQGATHSQSLQSIFGHFPGLYVAAPSSPADAKGLLVQALRLDTPVVLLENRSLRIARQGMDVTVVAVSLMVYEAYRAAELLAGQGVSVEVVDIRSIRPLDEAIICDSVARTGHLVVADTSWARYGFAAEVAAVVAEHALDSLRAPVRRVTLPDCPAPVSWPLENAFHPSAGKIAEACLGVLRADPGSVPELSDVTAGFVGPY